MPRLYESLKKDISNVYLPITCLLKVISLLCIATTDLEDGLWFLILGLFLFRSEQFLMFEMTFLKINRPKD